jgi:hypothetical protein
MIVFFLAAAGFGQEPPRAPAKEQHLPEIKPAELSLGAASPGRESSNMLTVAKSSPVPVRYMLKAPEYWATDPELQYDGTLGADPLTFKVTLKCFPAKEYPMESVSRVPVEISFESPARRVSFANELLPGRYKERFSFVFGKVEKKLTLYFRVLKDDNPVLLVDTHGLDFGDVESGRTVNRTIHIRNPGRGVLSWKIVPPPPLAGLGRYVSLFSQDARDNGPYALPQHLRDTVLLQGEWTAVEGNPLGRPGGSIQINFTGSGIIVYGVKDSDPGILETTLDDGLPEEVPCISGFLESTDIVTLGGLEEGPHKLVISRKDGVLFLEGFKVMGSGAMGIPSHWLRIFPDDGTTTGETDFINVTINTAGLTPGVYAGQLDIISNSGRAEVDISANVTVSSVPQIIRVFSFSRGRDVLYSCNPAAESPRKMAGYANRSFAFSLFREDTPGTRPLYRWYSQANANHYYTTSRDGDRFTHGYVLEGPIGNIATTRLPATRELYHWYSESAGMHTYTTSPGENLGRAKFEYQGIVGYVR